MKSEEAVLDIVLRRSSELEGTMRPTKKSIPTYTMRIHQKVCLSALGRFRFGFGDSPAVITTVSVPEYMVAAKTRTFRIH